MFKHKLAFALVIGLKLAEVNLFNALRLHSLLLESHSTIKATNCLYLIPEDQPLDRTIKF